MAEWGARSRADVFMRSFAVSSLIAAYRAVLFASGLVFLAGTAEAQSFLQNLFGIGQAQSRVEQPVQRPGVPAMSIPSRPGLASGGREFGRFSPQSRPNESWRSTDGDERSAPASGGKYRTLCVRGCDGYYFPISNSVDRARFMRDSAQCRAGCGDEARLYYMPAGSDNMSTMLDLAGRSYLRMPNAFKYRKSLIDGCSCKPMPWSEAETLRHKQYAAEAALAEARHKAAEDAEIARRLELDKIVPVAVARAMNNPGSNRGGQDRQNASSPGDAVPVQDGLPSKTDSEPQIEQPIVPVRPKLAARADRIVNGAGSANRPAQRAQRQPIVARVSAPSPSTGLGGSWLPASGQTYTWPGDAPRR
ncbi:MAG: hypothetical protein C0511_04840 [Hyphomicrobium sp.]|nr:hypothetical protein [Hyphomicrobium sp.]